MEQRFSQHGIPENVVSRNRLQYTSKEIDNFENIDFIILPVAPTTRLAMDKQSRWSRQWNHKNLTDPNSAFFHTAILLSWSLAELLVGWTTMHSNIPHPPEILVPQCTVFQGEWFLPEQEDYGQRHRARHLSLLLESIPKCAKSGKPVPGRIMTTAGAPRSCTVQRDNGQVR